MKIAGKECRVLYYGDAAEGDRLVHFDRVLVESLLNGAQISTYDLIAEVEFYQTDNKGKIFYDIPLRLVPLRWTLKILHKLGFKVYKHYEAFEPYQNYTKTISSWITSIKLGVRIDEE